MKKHEIHRFDFLISIFVGQILSILKAGGWVKGEVIGIKTDFEDKYANIASAIYGGSISIIVGGIEPSLVIGCKFDFNDLGWLPYKFNLFCTSLPPDLMNQFEYDSRPPFIKYKERPEIREWLEAYQKTNSEIMLFV